MKNYTVQEFANKFKVSEGHIYKLVKKGKIAKVGSLGKVIRIPSSEVQRLKNKKTELNYNADKVEVIQTHLGSIRRIKGEDCYVLIDLASIAKISSTTIIKDRVSDRNVRLLPFEESKRLGLNDFRAKGALVIDLQGIKEYLRKTRTSANWNLFLEELGDSIQVTIDSNEECIQPKIGVSETSGIKIIEQRELLGKDFKIYGTVDNPLFLAKSVAEWVDYNKTKQGWYDTSGMLRTIDRDEKVKIRTTINNPSGSEMWFITEDGLYEVLMQSRKPIAKEFKKEVKEILKQIRLTGGYVKNEAKFVDNYFNSFSEEIRKQMIEELKLKNNQLFIEKENIDKQLITNIELKKKIEESF